MLIVQAAQMLSLGSQLLDADACYRLGIFDEVVARRRGSSPAPAVA
jgi:hypothetical protein